MPTGYHFTSDTLRDGSPVPPIGEKLVFKGEIKICRSGLHWSEHPFDALQYAPGKWLHLVECSAPVDSQDDKHVSRERTILKTIDTDTLCRRFAADHALSVAHLWDMPDVVREYLTTLDENKRVAARDAAKDTAWYATGDATGATAWYATGYATGATARGAAWYAAWYATGATASGAAWYAAKYAAREDFKARVDAALAD